MRLLHSWSAVPSDDDDDIEVVGGAAFNISTIYTVWRERRQICIETRECPRTTLLTFAKDDPEALMNAVYHELLKLIATAPSRGKVYYAGVVYARLKMMESELIEQEIARRAGRRERRERDATQDRSPAPIPEDLDALTGEQVLAWEAAESDRRDPV